MRETAWTMVWALLMGLALCAWNPLGDARAYADDEEEVEVPETGGLTEGAGAESPEQKLQRIIELMRTVEERLYSGGVDQWTVETQEEIRRALEEQGEVSDKLNKLIEELEQMCQGSGSGSGAESMPSPQPSQSQQSEQQQDQTQQENQQNQENQSDQQQNGSEDNSQQSENNQRDQESQPDVNAQDPGGSVADDGWGELPPLLQREFADQDADIPEAYRERVEAFRRAIRDALLD